MTFKPDSLEAFIFYLAQQKALQRMQKKTLLNTQNLGLCDEEESALCDSLMLGLDRLDKEYEQLLLRLCQRTEKGDQIVAALFKVSELNQKETTDENRIDN